MGRKRRGNPEVALDKTAGRLAPREEARSPELPKIWTSTKFAD